MKLELDFIEKLAKIVKDNELTDITLEDGEQAITIRKEVATQVLPPMAPPVMPVAAQATVMPDVETKKEDKPKGNAITSPMVGTFYAAPAPDAKPFVEIGDTISNGTVVCVIEAMKLMNEIKSDFSGKITQICVKNGDPIEYGQVLMYVE